jgi:hypothetical protein
MQGISSNFRPVPDDAGFPFQPVAQPLLRHRSCLLDEAGCFVLFLFVWAEDSSPARPRPFFKAGTPDFLKIFKFFKKKCNKNPAGWHLSIAQKHKVHKSIG